MLSIPSLMISNNKFPSGSGVRICSLLRSQQCLSVFCSSCQSRYIITTFNRCIDHHIHTYTMYMCFLLLLKELAVLHHCCFIYTQQYEIKTIKRSWYYLIISMCVALSNKSHDCIYYQVFYI